MSTCIIIPSHIINAVRTEKLIKCLLSLVNQTTPIPIYLSISFETDLDKIIFNKLIEKNSLISNDILYVIYQEIKTSQFRHIEKIIDIIKDRYNFVMFCDDDDTYDITRVEKFMYWIECSQKFIPKDKIFVGVYELGGNLKPDSSERHSDTFYEYWAYCINIKFVDYFIKTIKVNNFDDYIDHKMCDVLFSTYLRLLDNNHMFGFIPEKLYNYNINKNEYSIIQQISKKNRHTKLIIQRQELILETFIKSVNKTIEENIVDIKSNIFVLYSMCMLSFENILERVLKDKYKYINGKILKQLKLEYDNIKYLCECLYHQKSVVCPKM